MIAAASNLSSFGAVADLKLPESLKTASEALLPDVFVDGTCFVLACSSLMRSAVYSPAILSRTYIRHSSSYTLLMSHILGIAADWSNFVHLAQPLELRLL